MPQVGHHRCSLQQVEAVDAQLLERLVGAGPDLAAREDLLDVDRHAPAAAGAERLHLGRHDRRLARPGTQRPSDHGLGLAVGAGGVDERHAGVERVVQRPDGLALVLRAEPAGEAHRAETELAHRSAVELEA